jgi:light-regulated signal transduction histidine kinase (bacteriophytochrome)
LRTIQAYINLLKKRYTSLLDDKAETYFHHLGQSSARMQAMIDSLLDYARLDVFEQEKTPVNMNNVLEQASKNIASLIKRNGATITSGSLPIIAGYPSHLLRLTQNLLSNSIKYRGKAAPEIHIEAEANEKGYLFSFSDNGIGIDPHHGDIIFSLFRRLHTSEHSEGTGIGLSVCKKIVENHMGQLWYTSEKGQGTTFFFTLPDN